MRWFGVETRLKYKKRVLASSLKRNLTYQNRVRILNKFDFQLIFLFLDAGNQHVDQHVQQVPHLIELLIAVRRVLQDAEDRNLK